MANALHKKGAITIDVEDGVSIAMRDVFGQKTPQTDRVVRCTHQILDLLANHEVKGTFFTLGQVGNNFPELVRRIVREGHELGVHGDQHIEFPKMNPSTAKNELLRAKKQLEDIAGVQIEGHRAPAFSIFPRTAWGLDVVASCGFSYDSSILPSAISRYGWPGFPKDIVRIKTLNNREITEVPISTLSLGRIEFPFSGGSYFRLLPRSLVIAAFDRYNLYRPGILYIHPYELDTKRYPDYYFAAMQSQPWFTRLKMKSMWWNRKSVHFKLSELLQKQAFSTMRNIIQEQPTLRKFHLIKSPTSAINLVEERA